MKGKRYTEEQIIGILKEHELDMPTQDVIRKHGIVDGTFYRCESKYGSVDVNDARRRRELESENAKIKRLLADTLLEKIALEDVLSKKW